MKYCWVSHNKLVLTDKVIMLHIHVKNTCLDTIRKPTYRRLNMGIIENITNRV